MFAGHLPEVIIILVVALIFLGPKRLPEAGSSIGKAIREFRHETQRETEDESESAEEAKPLQDKPRLSVPDSQPAVVEPQPVGSAVQSSGNNNHAEDQPLT